MIRLLLLPVWLPWVILRAVAGIGQFIIGLVIGAIVLGIVAGIVWEIAR